MYKLCKHPITNIVNRVERLFDNATIPFDPANTDYVFFKQDIQGIDSQGETITPAELQDADGNTMTAAEAKAYIATLP